MQASFHRLRRETEKIRNFEEEWEIVARRIALEGVAKVGGSTLRGIEIGVGLVEGDNRKRKGDCASPYEGSADVA